MTEEQELDSSEASEDKNWKAMREENKALKEKLEVFEEQAKVTVFKDAGLDTTQGIGKAISQVYKGDLNVEAIKTFALKNNKEFKDMAKLIRIAIVGTSNSPGIYDMMIVLGKSEVIRRFTSLGI